MNSEFLTSAQIRHLTGFSLGILFRNWQTDEAELVEYHDQQERLADELGPENVIGSLFLEGGSVEEGSLVLGIFTRHPVVIDGSLAPEALTRAQPAIEGGTV